MNDWTWLFIEYCWVAWVLFWVFMAFRRKRTIERSGFLGYRVVAIVFVVALVAAGRLLDHGITAGHLRDRASIVTVCRNYRMGHVQTP